MKKRKILSIATIILGAVTPTFASNWTDKFGYSNFTPGGSLKIKDSSGKTVETGFSTPSFSFRFKSGTSYEPIFRVSPPSIQAGCNGINIKGMFVSIISLKRLSEMLKNAGSSLAWGVLVGLIYSLPGIAATFRNLNQWAKTIQQLMQNACKSGIAIGQAVANKTGLDKYKGEDLMNVPSPQEIVNRADNQEESDNKSFFFGKLNFNTSTMALDFVGDDSDSDPSPEEVLSNWFKALNAAMGVRTINGILFSNLVRMIPSDKRYEILGEPIKDGFGVVVSKNISLDEISVSGDTINFGNFKSNISDPNNYAVLAVSLWEMALISNFGMDYTINKNAVNNLIKQIQETYNKEIGSTTSDPDFNEEEAMANIESYISGLSSPINLTLNSPKEEALFDFLKVIIKSMYLGENQINDDDKNKLDEIKEPKILILQLKEPKSNSVIYYIYNGGISTNSTIDKTELLSQYNKGLIELNKEFINKMISNGVASAFEAASNSSNPTDLFIASSFFVPKIAEKIALLQKLKPIDRDRYIQELAKYNAFFILNSFVDSLFSTIKGVTNYAPLFTAESGSNNILSTGKFTIGANNEKFKLDFVIGENAKVFSRVRDKLKQYIITDIYMNNIPDTQKIEQMFDDLNRKIREKSLKAIAGDR